MAIVTHHDDFDGVYGSNMLSATELGDKKLRVKIKAVHKEELQGRNPGEVARKRIVLDLIGSDKRLVLNATNFAVLKESLGNDPVNWIGAEIGIKAENTTFGGRVVKGLRVKSLGSLNAPEDAVPFAPEDAVPVEDLPF